MIVPFQGQAREEDAVSLITYSIFSYLVNSVPLMVSTDGGQEIQIIKCNKLLMHTQVIHMKP